MSDLVHKVETLEGRLHAIEVSQARSENDRQHMDARFDRIERQIEKQQGNISRLVWLLIIGIATAVLNFIVRGGLAA